MKDVLIKILISLSLASCVLCANSYSTKRVLRIVKWEPCPGPGHKSSNLILKNIHLTSSSVEKTIINSDIVINDVPNFKVMVTCLKCDSLAYESCERMFDIRKDACQDIKDNGILNQKLFSYMKPKFRCPPKNGAYTLANYTFDVDLAFNILKGLPDLYDKFWSLRVKYLTNQNKEIGCFDVAAKLYKLKKQ